MSYYLLFIISLMQLINRAHFLNINFVLALFASASAAAVVEAVTVPLTCYYASL